mgnify:CR=1 FL=1
MSSVSGRLQAAMPNTSSTMELIDTTIVRMTRTACNRRELVTATCFGAVTRQAVVP